MTNRSMPLHRREPVHVLSVNSSPQQRLSVNFNSILRTILLLSLLTGCASTGEYAQPYRAIGEVELHSKMRRMAASLVLLAEHANSVAKKNSPEQQTVITELEQIQTIASSIAPDDTITNYSVINQYMGAFLYDVRVAKEFAERDPPNLVPASRLLRSCLACHRSI